MHKTELLRDFMAVYLIYIKQIQCNYVPVYDLFSTGRYPPVNENQM